MIVVKKIAQFKNPSLNKEESCTLHFMNNYKKMPYRITANKLSSHE